MRRFSYRGSLLNEDDRGFFELLIGCLRSNVCASLIHANMMEHPRQIGASKPAYIVATLFSPSSPLPDEDFMVRMVCMNSAHMLSFLLRLASPYIIAGVKNLGFDR